MNRPFLRAGLIGGLILVLLNLLSLIPVVGLCTFVIGLIAYLAIGAAAAYWMAPRREIGRAAGQGALAGLIAAAISGVVQAVLAPLGISLSGGSQAIIEQLPAESLEQFALAGIDPNALASGGTFAGVALICCLPATLLIGAALGAIGGVILGAIKPE